MTDTSYQMPFGKYRGWSVCDLPSDYLRWLLNEADIHSERLRDALHAEHARRCGQQQDAQPRDRDRCPSPTVADELIGVGLRTLARRYHPDAGGSHDQMIAVTGAAEWLRRQVRELAR